MADPATGSDPDLCARYAECERLGKRITEYSAWLSAGEYRLLKQHTLRELSYFYDEQGCLNFRGKLPAETGALVLKALDRAIARAKAEVSAECKHLRQRHGRGTWETAIKAPVDGVVDPKAVRYLRDVSAETRPWNRSRRSVPTRWCSLPRATSPKSRRAAPARTSRSNGSTSSGIRRDRRRTPVAVYRGQCHCGALGFRFQTEEPPSRWAVRACQCTFCTAHGAACISDPSGAVSFLHTQESELQRYRFGLRTADFLLCRNCGVYIGALLTDEEGTFATLNTRAMNGLRGNLPTPQASVYDGETSVERRHRRIRRWTPVVQNV